MGILLSALGDCFTLFLHPAPRLLHQLLALISRFRLALYLIFHRQVDRLEAVHVFNFHLSTEFRAALRTHTDISVAAETPLLHVAGGNAQVLQNAAQLHEVLAGLFRGAEIRFADDLHQGSAGAVDIHQAVVATR